MKLTFCGAAREVTGSCFFFETDSSPFLVDCGLFQGGRESRLRNRERFPFDPRRMGFVVLTHAHLDHSGLLPRLYAEGFKGPIYTTQATADLLAVLLPDSAYLQQVEAERAARHGRDFIAAYGVDEARAVLKQVRAVAYDELFEPAAGIRVRLRDAGHILGSAIVELWLTEPGRTRKVVISGDLGQPGRPIVRDPAIIDEADVLLLESTYGNRDHKPLDATLDELFESLNLVQTRKIQRIPIILVGAEHWRRVVDFDYLVNEGFIDVADRDLLQVVETGAEAAQAILEHYK